MPRLSRAVLALSATPVVVTASGNSAIGKVIDLLKDMQSQVESETNKGAAEAEATENQCIADISKLEGDVKYTGEKAEEAAAAKEEGAAKAATYAAEADKLVPEIASAEASKKDAKKAFNKEAAAFAAEEAEMSEAVTMLTSAYSVLEKSLGGSFLQGSSKTMSSGLASASAKQVVTALRSVVDAAWLDASSPDAQQLKAFVQEQENTGDEASLASALSLAQQPAAPAVKNYESKSGGILDAIAGMQEKAEAELAGLKEKALKAKHAYELLSQDLTSKIELKTEQMEAAKTSSAEFTASSEKGAAELAEASEALDSYKSTLTETQAGCTKAAEDWAARSAEAGEEVAAIAKAVEILSGKFAPAPEGEAFIQMGARVKGSKKFLGVAQNTDFEARAKAASLLRRMGETYSNFQFLQAATAVSQSAGADPFKKVRKMITDMIAKLEDEQAEEAAKEGKCVADKAKGKKNIKVKGTQLKQLQARSDKANAKVSELATDLSELADEVKGLEASRAGWTKDRHSSKAENSATIKEAAESVEALNAAISALEEFYGSGAEATSFLQTKTGKLSDKAEAIISILQTAQSDFEKLKQATEKAEADASSSYDKDMQASEVSLAKAKATIEGKTSEQATVKAQITQIDEDLVNAQKAFEAASSFLKSVNEACANKPMTFEEKQAKRKAEIEGLKTAFSILSGE